MALTRHFLFIVSRLVRPLERKVEKDDRGRHSVYIMQNATGGTERIGSKENPKAKNWLFFSTSLPGMEGLMGLC
jgi:hypothetical protein